MDLKKYRQKLVGSEEERAVSPVIGVVLMVAITVILAAVIAAFVMDMGDDMGESAPNAQLDLEENTDWNPDGGDNETIATLSHNGGDEVSTDNIEFQFDGDESTTLDGSDNFLEGDSDGDYFGFVALDSGNEITTGDSIEITSLDEGDLNSDPPEFDAGEDYELTIVHEPSDSILYDTEFSAADP